MNLLDKLATPNDRTHQAPITTFSRSLVLAMVAITCIAMIYRPIHDAFNRPIPNHQVAVQHDCRLKDKDGSLDAIDNTHWYLFTSCGVYEVESVHIFNEAVIDGHYDLSLDQDHRIMATHQID